MKEKIDRRFNLLLPLKDIDMYILALGEKNQSSKLINEVKEVAEEDKENPDQ